MRAGSHAVALLRDFTQHAPAPAATLCALLRARKLCRESGACVLLCALSDAELLLLLAAVLLLVSCTVLLCRRKPRGKEEKLAAAGAGLAGAFLVCVAMLTRSKRAPCNSSLQNLGFFYLCSVGELCEWHSCYVPPPRYRCFESFDVQWLRVAEGVLQKKVFAAGAAVVVVACQDQVQALWDPRTAPDFADLPAQHIIATTSVPSHGLRSNFSLYGPSPAARQPHHPAVAMAGVYGQFFHHSIQPTKPQLPFEQRNASVVWRGMASGPMSEGNLRFRIVKRLWSYRSADVGFSGRDPLEVRAFYRAHMPNGGHRGRLTHAEMVRHQAILVISGHGNPTNLPFALASGSVPVVCLHWVPHDLEFFTAWQHYIPVRPSLDDLEKALDWIWAHPQQARLIASRAQRRSMKIFTPVLYRRQLRQQIEAMISGAASAHEPI